MAPLVLGKMPNFLKLQPPAQSRQGASSLRVMPEKSNEPKQTTPAGHRIRIPSREDFERIIKKVAPPPAGRKRPDETGEPREQSER